VIPDGTVKPDTSQPMPTSSDSEKQAAAKALLANLKLAAVIGMAARKNAGKENGNGVSFDGGHWHVARPSS
jgi:hypothetical protein